MTGRGHLSIPVPPSGTVGLTVWGLPMLSRTLGLLWWMAMDGLHPDSTCNLTAPSSRCFCFSSWGLLDYSVISSSLYCLSGTSMPLAPGDTWEGGGLAGRTHHDSRRSRQQKHPH